MLRRLRLLRRTSWRDFIAVSRAPLHKLQTYKQRMGWRFPWVSSSFSSDFNLDFVAPERLAAAREDLERRGLPAILHATSDDIDLTFREAARATGHQVELHADSQGLRDFFAMIYGASVEWDGSEPLRSPS